MNIGQVKLLSWTTAALLTAGLGAYVWSFVARLDQKRLGPEASRIQAALEAVPAVKERASDTVAYDDVRRLFLPSCDRCKNDPQCPHLNWTGKPPPPPVVESQAPVDSKAPRIPVKEIVRILMVQVDLSAPAQSGVFLKYRPEAKVSTVGIALGVWLREGDRLAAPHQGVRIQGIRAEGVVFAFDEEGRENEALLPDEYDLRSSIVKVGPEGARLPLVSQLPTAAAAPFRPAKTTPFGENRYWLGTDDLAYLGEHYAEELTNNVRWRKHQDPRTGKYDGIEITSVTPGSVAAAHGAQEGDVIKSINGTPVSSVQEAIHFVKTHSNQYTTWEVVVESKGKLKTVIYHSPN